MKIKYLIFSVFIVSIVINSAIIVFFVSSKVSEIGNITTKTGSETLMSSVSDNLLDIASGVKNSLDKELQNQYLMVKTWANTPTLLDTARSAQGKTKEELYEMWSAEATRVYNDNEAVGDGNPANDLNPSASLFLTSLSNTAKFYPEIFITDNRGYAIAANVATGDFDQGPEEWRIFLENGKPVMKKFKPTEFGEPWYEATNKSPEGFWVSDVSFDESTKTWGLEIDSQLKEQARQDYLGQIKAVVDFSGLVDNLVDLSNLNIDSVRIVTQDGKIIGKFDKTGSQKTQAADLELVDSAFLSEIKSKKTAGIFNETVNGQKFITAYQTSNDQNKYIVAVTKAQAKISQPIDNFVGSLKANIDNKGNELFNSIMIIAMIVGLLAIIIFFVLVNTQIVTPINKLSEVADKLSDGDFEVELPIIKTGNEVEKLSALTAMLVSTIKQLKKTDGKNVVKK